jgi:hypothetical protein
MVILILINELHKGNKRNILGMFLALFWVRIKKMPFRVNEGHFYLTMVIPLTKIIICEKYTLSY